MTQPGFPAYGAFSRPPQYGSIPPAHVSIPPAPPPQKKSQLPLILGAAGAAAVLLIAGGAIAVWKVRSRTGLPVDAKMLPAPTKEVGTRLVEATRETNPQVKRVYLASELGSSLCKQGADPARRLESIGALGPHVAKDFFFDKKKIEETQQLLDCGSALAADLESPYQSFVSFDDDEGKPHHVTVMKLGTKSLPPRLGFAYHSFGRLDGYCKTEDGADCGDHGNAAFVNGGTWFLGERATLDTMAKTVATPREELSSSVAALKDASAATDGLPVVRLSGNPKSSKEFFLAPCHWAAVQSGAGFSEFVDGCFPSKEEEHTLTQIDAKLRGAAYELDGDYAKASAVVGDIVFVARDADAAKTLESDVSEIVADWKAHLENNDAKLIKDSRDKAFSHSQKKFAAVVDTFFGALHEMKVSRSGRTVRVAYKKKLSKDDQIEIAEADRTTVEKRVATAEVLDAIQSKRAIPVGSLAQLVGSKWATYLTGPAPAELHPPAKTPLATAECQSIQSRLVNVKFSDLPDGPQRDLYFKLRFALCASRPPEVEPQQHACLATFKTAADFASCTPAPRTPANEPPESDFGDKRK